MKKIFYLIIFLSSWGYLKAQTITSATKANFGVDAELRANFYNNIAQSGTDDWFNNGTAGTGAFVIDTTGAGALVARYAIDPAFRKLPFYRAMKYTAYSTVNNKLLLDAIFIRDYHGTDSTIFASGASKNGESPADWTCPVAQSIPDKNEILDMMVHIRRAGPASPTRFGCLVEYLLKIQLVTAISILKCTRQISIMTGQLKDFMGMAQTQVIHPGCLMQPVISPGQEMSFFQLNMEALL